MDEIPDLISMLEIACIHNKEKPRNAYTHSSSYITSYVKVESVHEIADNQWNNLSLLCYLLLFPEILSVLFQKIALFHYNTTNS